MEKRNTKQNPFDDANLLSKITFWWLNPLFRIGFRRQLESDDLYDVPCGDESTILVEKLERHWNQQLQKRKNGEKINLCRTVLWTFAGEWILPAILFLLSEGLKIIQPLLIAYLICYFNPHSEMTMLDAYLYGVGLGVSAVVQVLVNPLYYFIMQRVAMKMRTAVGGLIYKKVLSLSSKSFSKTTSGQIVNLLSSDIEKFYRVIENLHSLWLTPIVVAVCVVLIYREVGLSCLFSLIVIIPLLPYQIISGRIFGRLRTKLGSWSDKRIHTMAEILSGMRVIKMYCWEQPFGKLINALRRSEIGILRQSEVFKAFNDGLSVVAARMIAVLVFVGNWIFEFEPLSVRAVFTTLVWLDVVRVSVFYIFFNGIILTTELVASMKRVQSFLLLDEDMPECRVCKFLDANSNTAVNVDGVTAKWENGSSRQDKKIKQDMSSLNSICEEGEPEMSNFSLKDITLHISKGELVIIVGAVGSGKSSLLMALLGELPYEQGQIYVHGTLGYASQQAWVLSGTVRDNVLLGDDFDQERYSTVIQACALDKDTFIMPNGDLTLVGERGLLLSGGQKTRLTLARCVYREADIYLLDDPLSAVDTKVGKHIFHRCLQGMLKGKTRILITHQLQYLKMADRIIVIKEGAVSDSGTYDELLTRAVNLEAFVTADTQDQMENTDTETGSERKSVQVKEYKFNISSLSPEKVTKEDKESGGVSLKVYWQYLTIGYGKWFFLLVLVLLTAIQMFGTASDWMLARWAELENKISANVTNSNFSKFETSDASTSSTMYNLNTTENKTSDWEHMSQAMQLYIIFLIMFIFINMTYAMCLANMGVTASQRLHNKMFKFVLGAKTRFFDTNPVGRILNRFSRDLGFIDTMLIRQFYLVTKIFMLNLSGVVITCLVNPWLFIPAVPVVVAIIMIRYYSVQTIRDVKRLEAVERSPFYSHVSDTLNGLQTIRAFQKQPQFIRDLHRFQNAHTSAWFLYLSSYRWFSFRSVHVVTLFFNVAIIACILLKDSISSGLLALSLTHCIGMIEPLEFLMRMSADLENNMTSVERVVAYTNLVQEGKKISSSPPPKHWPENGAITFKDMCLRYETHMPMALKHINCTINSNEKIGVVGRTGAGKSSLMSALLRLAEPEGRIIIDGIDITQIGLHDLRQKISVIPQDPFIFSGTIRKNLDPFEKFDDEKLWSAIEQVQLKDKIESANGQLHMEVTESGNNFSVGQRQLICLARALLHDNKILILDEATANVDHRTDELIQKTVRECFKDCTILTIAHRLHTVMDCDRIMALDEGELKEFDKPHVLLRNEAGYLSALLEETGQKQSEQLREIAYASYKSSVPFAGRNL